MPASTDIGKVTKPPDKPNLLEHDCVWRYFDRIYREWNLISSSNALQAFLGQNPTDKRRNKSFLGDRQNFLAIEYRARGWSDNDKDHMWSISDGVSEVWIRLWAATTNDSNAEIRLCRETILWKKTNLFCKNKNLQSKNPASATSWYKSVNGK